MHLNVVYFPAKILDTLIGGKLDRTAERDQKGEVKLHNL